MSRGITLVCPRCGRRFAPGDRTHCPDHATSPVLDASYNCDRLREAFDPATASRNDIWRYRPLLPVGEGEPVTLGEGWTPLLPAPTAGERLDLDLSLKLEGANPTGSSKDRGSAVLATRARADGVGDVVCASTGNAAASIAAYAARGDLDCSLFVPERLSAAKAVQPRVYGADVVSVEGNYSDAVRACRKRGREDGRFDRSAGANPYVAVGSRTLGFELAEQTDRPDWVAVAMGNGGTLADLWTGWQLFRRLGYVESSPRLLGVQAASTAPIHRQWTGEEDDSTRHPRTCADSIDVTDPRRADDAIAAIDESDGATVTVGDPAIERSLRSLGAEEGVFAEPASAAVLAGIEAARSQGTIRTGASVVAIVTGDGLKDPETATQSLEP